MSDADTTGRRRVLIVEDEALVSLLVETMLDDAGFDVTVADSVGDALRAIDRATPDAAILDLNLKGVKAYPVADALSAAGVPFVFATGGEAIDGYSGRPFVTKPYMENQLLDALGRLF